MGCGSSQVGPTDSEQRPGDKPHQNGALQTKDTKTTATDSNANRQDTETSNPVPKSVAFTVTLDGEQANGSMKFLGPPPPRLKRLDPLNVPQLTAEQLAEKQRLADEKREQQIKRKQSASLKASRRRQQILEAQKFGQEQEQVEKEQKIQESLASAGKSREAKLKDIQEKQQIRQERARRAREKVHKLNQLDNELDIDVEKDDDYNGDEVDSWLDGDNNNNNNRPDALSADSGDRIYSGRTSPKKRFNADDNGLRRGISANTVDSFDNAYNRKPPSGSKTRNTANIEEDDFFDS